MDPIANLLTVIRNGQHANKTFVSLPYSKITWLITSVLYSHGFIRGMGVRDDQTRNVGIQKVWHRERNTHIYITKVGVSRLKHTLRICIVLKPNGRILGKMIHSLVRVSSPKKRVYLPVHHIRNTMGFGIRILSTTKGIMSDRQAIQANVGGEILCACV